MRGKRKGIITCLNGHEFFLEACALLGERKEVCFLLISRKHGMIVSGSTVECLSTIRVPRCMNRTKS